MSYVNSYIAQWTERVPNNPKEVADKPLFGIEDIPLERSGRYGIPDGSISWSENKDLVADTLARFMKLGRNFKMPAYYNPKYKKHLQYFRNHLDIYDIIVDKPVYSVDEIFFRCLREGPRYASFIKKARLQSLQRKESLEDTDSLEYAQDEYWGYDSIIHERYLIFWDESENIQDWKYSLLKTTTFKEEEYRNAVKALLKSVNWHSSEMTDTIKITDSVANKRSSTCEGGKTTLLKNTWFMREDEPWYAARKVVPTFPGSTRDTGVPDANTLFAVKLINKFAQNVSRRCPYSALTTIEQLQRRIARVRDSRYFVHVDFKKFGLSTDRRVGNIILEEAGKSHLKIGDVFLHVDGTTYKTNRGGGSLGWCDPLFALGVIAVLRMIKIERNWSDMDFIVFNDDVEISFKRRNLDETILRKEYILSKLCEFGFLLSYRKIYVSRMSVFLEDYSMAMNVNMDKTQLAVGSYAKSISSLFEWEAKFNYSEGWQRVRSMRLKEKCQIHYLDNLDPDRPYEVGGWCRLIDHTTGLNHALRHANRDELEFFLRMKRYREPHVMPKWEYYDAEIISNNKAKQIDSSVRKILDTTDLEMDQAYELDQVERMQLEYRIEMEARQLPPRPTLPPRERQEEFKGGT